MIWYDVKYDGHQKLVDKAIEIYGKLDLYVNNLGISAWMPINKIDEKFLIKLITTNEKKSHEIINNIRQKILADEVSQIKSILLTENKSKNKNLNPDKDVESKCSQVLLSIAEKYHIDSTIIANKRDIEIFSTLNKNTRFMKGWRYQIFGKLVQ